MLYIKTSSPVNLIKFEGFPFSYGKGELSNPFIGFGDFFVDTVGGDVKMGELYASFFFQFSYAATGRER